MSPLRPGKVIGAGRIAEVPVNDERVGFPLAEERLATTKRATSLGVGRGSGTDTVS